MFLIIKKELRSLPAKLMKILIVVSSIRYEQNMLHTALSETWSHTNTKS